MEIIKKKSGKYVGERILICCLFLLFTVCGKPSVAQAPTDSASTSAQSKSDDGPDIKNIQKLLPTINPEVEKMQEQQKHDEFMSYIYMGFGFAVVIAIAWFTTSLAKKRRLKEDEERLKRAQTMQSHHPHRKPHRR
jgi:flagellar biosynthesis/type III secretory pathway M-ring protein FliF/YscJ